MDNVQLTIGDITTARTDAIINAANPAVAYPAGVSPAVCPNFPNCDNSVRDALLQANPAIAYPAGVSAATCPYYPQC